MRVGSKTGGAVAMGGNQVIFPVRWMPHLNRAGTGRSDRGVVRIGVEFDPGSRWEQRAGRSPSLTEHRRFHG